MYEAVTKWGESNASVAGGGGTTTEATAPGRGTHDGRVGKDFLTGVLTERESRG